jgi:CRP/FNR family cyclic AMP-dependent transcriptional regulator
MPELTGSPSTSKFFKKGIPDYYKKGALILGIDPEPNGVYYIDSGFVKVYSITDGGEEFLHIIYSHGEIFPLVWAYVGIQSELYYEAVTDTLTWRISKEQFTSYIESNLDGSNGIAKQMALQFHIYSDRLDNLEYKKSAERVAYRLLYLAGRFGLRQGTDMVINAPITQELIASSINLARESVTREFTILEHKKIIEHSKNHIIIKDLRRLRAQLSEPTSLKYWGLN